MPIACFDASEMHAFARYRAGKSTRSMVCVGEGRRAGGGQRLQESVARAHGTHCGNKLKHSSYLFCHVRRPLSAEGKSSRVRNARNMNIFQLHVGARVEAGMTGISCQAPAVPPISSPQPPPHDKQTKKGGSKASFLPMMLAASRRCAALPCPTLLSPVAASHRLENTVTLSFVTLTLTR